MNEEAWRDGWGALEAKIRSWTASWLERAGIMPFPLGLKEEMPPPHLLLAPAWMGYPWGGTMDGGLASCPSTSLAPL